MAIGRQCLNPSRLYRLSLGSLARRLALAFTWIFLGTLFLWSGSSLGDETLEGEHVRVQWLAPEQFAANTPITIGIHFDIDPEWHLYWRNAGDSGAAPRFDFTATQASVSEPLWPYPKRLPIAHLTNLGYEGEVAYLFELTPKTGREDQLILEVELEWLVCKIDCIPGFGTLTLERPIADSGPQWEPDQKAQLARFEERIPAPSEQSPWKVQSARVISQTQLQLQLSGPADTDELEVFPLDGAFVSAAEPRRERTEQGLKLTFAITEGMASPETLRFVASAKGQAWAFDEIQVEPRGAAPATNNPKKALAFWWLLASAFIGGVILNLMPCVFPVLSIKLFSLIRNQGADRASAALRLREGLLYSAGVLTTFAALGAVFLLLRAGGAAVGWGFQLQSPPVVLALVLLFWLMALSFIGAFDFGQSLVRLAGRSGANSAFGTGVLAVFVAAPCTGPFMGAALGASATLPPVSAMAIFLGLGAGLAAPFLILAVSPALSSRLPKPGAWMESLRQFLAFPLFATVVWLLWVLGRLSGEDGWLIGGIVLLAISFAIWLARSVSRLWKAMALIISLIVAGWAFVELADVGASRTDEQIESDWQAYDADLIARAREEGQAVFIDFTAAWCVTCQINKKLVLDTRAAQELFDQRQVLLVRADWTRQDPAITKALSALGRNSVPVYVFYAKEGGQPEILPQILTQEVLQKLFDT